MTARVFAPAEALAVGFVSAVLPDKAAAVARAVELAALIASKSPVAVQGTKAIIEYSREHGIDDGESGSEVSRLRGCRRVKRVVG